MYEENLIHILRKTSRMDENWKYVFTFEEKMKLLRMFGELNLLHKDH